MAAGLPVVVPRVAAMPELVEDGVTGLLVPPGDDDAFASALASLAADPDRRAAFGAAGRERVQARFDAEVTTNALVDVLQDAAV
jgi:glycosyltransferase involved in cell wall biosynthesis